MVALLFITFAVCLAAGVPVAFSLGISSLVYFIGEGMSLYMFAQRFFAGLNSFTLLCIPGFVFAGSLMNQGGITERLIGFCNKIVGHITGGLSIANVVASMLFAGISGTALADTVSVGGVLIPAMKKDGYDADFSCAVTAASSCIGPIIPPVSPHDYGSYHDRAFRGENVRGRLGSRCPHGPGHDLCFLVYFQEA